RTQAGEATACVDVPGPGSAHEDRPGDNTTLRSAGEGGHGEGVLLPTGGRGLSCSHERRSDQDRQVTQTTVTSPRQSPDGGRCWTRSQATCSVAEGVRGRA